MDISADNSLVNEFVIEGRRLLSSIDPDLSALKASETEITPDMLDRILRVLRNITSSTGFLGLDDVNKLSHALEDMLLRIRDGILVPDRVAISELLSGMDTLRAAIEAICADDHTAAVEVGAREVRSGTPLDPALEIKPTKALELVVDGPPYLGRVAFQVDPEALKSAEFEAMDIHAIWLQSEESDFTGDPAMSKLEAIGRVLGSDMDAPETVLADVPGYRHLLLATILEDPDMVCMALDVPEEYVVKVPFDQIEAVLAASASPPGLGLEGKGESDVHLPSLPELKNIPDESRPHLPVPNDADEPAFVASPPEYSALVSQARDKTIPPPAAIARETIRVNLRLIDRMMNLAGELVLGRNQLRRLLEDNAHHFEGLAGILQNFDVVTTTIQEQIMRLRMQPLSNVLKKFHRLVRDLSHQSGKQVDLVIEGGEVELDKSILETLSEPLQCLIRYAVEEALESSEEREQSGKPAAGQLTIRAFHEEGLVNITVTDDGRGLDYNEIVQKATAQGLIDAPTIAAMSDSEMMNLIFAPNILFGAHSSADGIRLDQVRAVIEYTGGRIEVTSAVGRGNTFRLRLPLTLAIIPALIVRAEDQSFAIPQMDVAELVYMHEGDRVRRIERIGEASVLRLRGRLLPLLRLSDVLGLNRHFTDPDDGEIKSERRMRIADRRGGDWMSIDRESAEEPDDHERRMTTPDRRHEGSEEFFIMVLRAGPNCFGLLVDDLLDTEEIVVKPLSDHLKDCRYYSGATIMGDGRVAMILSATGIAASTQLRFGEVDAEERRRKDMEARLLGADSGLHRSVIVFNNALDEYFALPVSDVSRLEKIDAGSIYRVGRREFVTYRGDGLPLIRLEHYLQVDPFPNDIDELYLVVPKAGDAAAGIMASRIVDILNTDAEVVDERAPTTGLLGSAVIEGKLTMFLDAAELMAASARDLQGGN